MAYWAKYLLKYKYKRVFLAIMQAILSSLIANMGSLGNLTVSQYEPMSYNSLAGFKPDGWNDWEEQWVAYANWQYSLTFNLTMDQVNGNTLYLRCGGLDTVANIT